jgi:hypothetical protein
MTTTDRLRQRLGDMPTEQRHAWEERFLRDLDAHATQADPLDSLTPEQTAHLRALLDEGLDALDRGEGTPWNAAAFIEQMHERHSIGP